MRMRRLAQRVMLTVTIVLSATVADAQDTRVMPLDQVKNILNLTRDSWISFREFNGQQLVYFTQIITWKCGIREIRYSLNAGDLSERFPLPKCDPLLPNNVGQNDKIYLRAKLDVVKSVAVQLAFDDDTVSDIHIYGPCPGAGQATCGRRFETLPAMQ